ncbi:DUF3800 domain-containing protein [Elizabethkingia anophelis]|uniref:DUF3800 domain-containing protein n=1 Tax=Elizabethkingia anophelis TaxID=1117645 RepID=UPI0038916644
METIYFDESGNTGSDLLNQDQKVFILCSNRFTASECQELLILFNDVDELHFVNLKNSIKGRASIIKLLNHELITEDKISIYCAHKEYVTVCIIVDQLIESVYHRMGIDIYKYGQNIQIATYIFYFGNSIWNKEYYTNFIESFIRMFRKKDENSIQTFYKTVKKLYNSIDQEYKILLEPIINSKSIINDILFSVDKFTIDITLSTFLVLCNYWYRELDEKFNVTFDNSKQIEHYIEYIKFLRDLNTAPQDIGFGSRKMVFPTQINNITLADSKNEINIQISDIIASAVSFQFNNKNSRYSTFVKNIQDSNLMKLKNVHNMWPSTNISVEELGMENSNGINVLDFLAFHSANKH